MSVKWCTKRSVLNLVVVFLPGCQTQHRLVQATPTVPGACQHKTQRDWAEHVLPLTPLTLLPFPCHATLPSPQIHSLQRAEADVAALKQANRTLRQKLAQAQGAQQEEGRLRKLLQADLEELRLERKALRREVKRALASVPEAPAAPGSGAAVPSSSALAKAAAMAQLLRQLQSSQRSAAPPDARPVPAQPSTTGAPREREARGDSPTAPDASGRDRDRDRDSADGSGDGRGGSDDGAVLERGGADSSSGSDESECVAVAIVFARAWCR